MSGLLQQAADRREQGEKIVLVIDALDEAGTPPNQNVLSLPRVLPPGVFIIVSQRPGPELLTVDTATTPRRPFQLHAGSLKNLEDMRRFLEQAATWPGIAQVLRTSGYTPEQLTSTLLDKCDGMWMYLHFVIHEIDRGERTPLNLNELPNGMTQYYINYWGGHRWRLAEGRKIRQEWNEMYLPLLATLAAAQEAVTVERLVEWAGVKQQVRSVQQMLDTHWRPFMATSRQERNDCYRFLHSTLYEFFSGQTNRDRLTITEVAFVDELAAATREAHHRLANRYMECWGGLQAALPGLTQDTQRTLDNGYGLRYLAVHLERAERYDELHQLLQLQRIESLPAPVSQIGLRGWFPRFMRRRPEPSSVRPQLIWREAREKQGDTGGFLSDMQRAWQLADQAADQAVARALSAQECARILGLQCRYALMTASMNSLASHVPPRLVVALVEKSIWTLEQGLAYTAQIINTDQRARTILGLATYLAKLGSHQKAWDVVQRFGNIYWRARALEDLAPYLPEILVRQALDLAWRMLDAPWRMKALLALLSRLAQLGFSQEAQEAVRKIKEKPQQAELLATLLPYLSQTEQATATAEILPLALGMTSALTRALTLSRLLPYLPDAEQPHIFNKALEAIQELPRLEGYGRGNFPRVQALVEMLPHLPEMQRRVALDTAREEARQLPILDGFKRSSPRATALAKLMPYVVASERPTLLAGALEAVQAIEQDERVNALAELAAYLPEQTLCEAMDEAMNASDRERQNVLDHLAPYLSEPMLRKALNATRTVGDSDARTETIIRLSIEGGNFLAALEMLPKMKPEVSLTAGVPSTRIQLFADLMPHMPESSFQKALDIVRRFTSKEVVQILEKLMPALSEVLLRQALRIVQNKLWDHDQVRGLTILAPHLSKALLRQSLKVAQRIPTKFYRVQAFVQLARFLPEAERMTVLLKARNIARRIKVRKPVKFESGNEIVGEDRRVQALACIIPHLPETMQTEILHEAFTIAKTVPYAHSQADGLVAIVPYLPPHLLEEALSIAQKIASWQAQLHVLGGMAPYLPERLLRKALESVEAILDGLQKQQTLLDTINIPTEDFQVKRALDWRRINVTSLQKDWAKACTKLLVRLAELGYKGEAFGRLLKALETAEAWEPALLAELAPHLEESSLAVLLDSLPDSHEISKGKVLAVLAPYCTEALLNKAIAVLRGIRSEKEKAQALKDLAPHLPEPLLYEALDIAKQIEMDSQGLALAGLIPYLPDTIVFQPVYAGRQSHERSLIDQATLSICRIASEPFFEKADVEKRGALLELTKRLKKMEINRLRTLWGQMLHAITSHDRKSLLMDLGTLAPLIAFLDGQAALDETKQAIEEVAYWFP